MWNIVGVMVYEFCMTNKFRTTDQTLRSFIDAMWKHDPMGLNGLGNPGEKDEYSSEALSMLARMTETHVVACPYQDTALAITVGLLQQVWVMWFLSPIQGAGKVNALAAELLSLYDAGYPNVNRTATANELLGE